MGWELLSIAKNEFKEPGLFRHCPLHISDKTTDPLETRLFQNLGPARPQQRYLGEPLFTGLSQKISQAAHLAFYIHI